MIRGMASGGHSPLRYFAWRPSRRVLGWLSLLRNEANPSGQTTGLCRFCSEAFYESENINQASSARLASQCPTFAFRDSNDRGSVSLDPFNPPSHTPFNFHALTVLPFVAIRYRRQSAASSPPTPTATRRLTAGKSGCNPFTMNSDRGRQPVAALINTFRDNLG
jgi:hypothetical protein